MIDIVFWDIGGTLMHRKMSDIHYYKSIFEKVGISYSEIQWQDFSTFVNKAKEIRLDYTLQTIQNEKAAYRLLLEEYISHDAKKNSEIIFEIIYNHKYFVVPQEALDLLGFLQKHSIKQAVISNWAPSLLVLLEAHQMHTYFSNITCSGIEGVAKPDVSIFQFALDKENIMGSRALMIGDLMEYDIIPAQRAGLHTIEFSLHKQSYSELKNTLIKFLQLGKE